VGRRYALTIAPNRHAGDNARRDYSDALFPRFRLTFILIAVYGCGGKTEHTKTLP
jgi:hypothetical protein